MRSPVVAMLWENWQLTRTEVAWRLTVGIAGGWTIMVLFAALAPHKGATDFGAALALLFMFLPHLPGWLSISKLNGGRPGFPFHLLYTYPVRTAVLVGVPMAYFAVVPAMIYCVSALVLRATFGSPFPLLPVATWVAAYYAMTATASWWTRNVVLRILGVMAVAGAWFVRAVLLFDAHRIFDFPSDRWPAMFDAPLGYYVAIGVIGLASFGLLVAAVARQRRGETSGALPRMGFAEISPFRFRCPISSATRAQVWFELRSSGLPLLTIGLVLAIMNPLLFAVGIPIDAALEEGFHLTCRLDGCFWARPFALMFAMLSGPAVLVFAANAFGLRAKQGRLYTSAFDATRPSGTGRLAGVKVLVRSISVLIALTTIVASAWASGLFIAAGDVFLGDPNLWPNPVRSWQSAIEGAVGALIGYQLVALAVVAFIGVAVFVASWAALAAVWTRYPRRLNVAASVLLLYGLGLVLLVLASQRWSGLQIPLGAIFRTARWVAAAVTVMVTTYLALRVVAERLLTPRQAGIAVVVSTAFGAAWVTMLRAAGVPLTAMPTTDVVWALSPMLLPFTMSVLAPWSLSRIRHT